jgi:hypothetical protein
VVRVEWQPEQLLDRCKRLGRPLEEMILSGILEALALQVGFGVFSSGAAAISDG